MKVSFGQIDGNGWEKHCQRLLRLSYKHRNGNYTEIPARFGGDLGLEGFGDDGRAFQCFCPDTDPTAKELHDSQIRKVRDDIKKLAVNELELKKLLGQTIIKHWCLVTPKYENKDLIKYCKKKAAEIRAKGLSHIDKDFDIFIQTEEDYIVERGMLLNHDLLKLDIEPIGILDTDIDDWKLRENKSFKIIKNKLSKIPNSPNVDHFVELNIKAYLLGQNVIENLRKNFPDLHETLMKYKAAQELEVAAFSQIQLDEPGKQLKDAVAKYRELIAADLGGNLATPTIIYLAHEAIADWLIRCPLDF